MSQNLTPQPNIANCQIAMTSRPPISRAPGRHTKGQPSIVAPEATKTARGVSASRIAPGISPKLVGKCHNSHPMTWFMSHSP